MNDTVVEGNIGHLDNVIDTDGLESLKGTEVDKSKPQMEYCVSPEGHRVIVPASCRLLTVAFSFDRLFGEKGESLWQAQNKPKRGKTKHRRQLFISPKAMSCMNTSSFRSTSCRSPMERLARPH